MKNLMVIVGVTVLVLGAGLAYWMMQPPGKQTTIQPGTVQTGDRAYIAVDACSVLTQAIADSVLGHPSTKGDTTAGNASTDSLSVSNCVYSYKPVSSGSGLEQLRNTTRVSVLVRAAKDATGATSNQAQFDNPPAGSESVTGYGEKAFWNPSFGQLNVLKDNNWYILNYSMGTDPRTGTLDQAKQLASALNL